MKRLLTTTTALSMVFSPLAPLPVFAQTEVKLGDSVVICLPEAKTVCPEGATCVLTPEAPCDQSPEAMAEAKKATDAAAQAATDAAAAQAATDAAAAADAAAAQAATDAAAAADAAAAQAATDAAAAADAAAAQAATDAAAAADAAAAQAATDAAAAALPVLEPAPGVAVPSEEAVTSLTDILSETPQSSEAPAGPAAAAAATDATAQPGATETTITAGDSRSSSQEFAAPAATDAPAATATAADAVAPAKVRRHKGLTDLEKFGLVVLGALVVGAVLKNGDKVVSNTGDRVVVQRDDGSYVVMKDDDTLLRQPGATVRTENFTDGSTRSTVEYPDGSRIVTIRDASGRVLRRSSIDATGHEVLLIDDLTPVQQIDVATLPQPRPDRTIVSGQDEAATLRAALVAIDAGDVGRRFSLRQIREYPQVRALAPTIDVENVTFDTGSAAIKVSEAAKLAQLGRLIANLIAANPAEMFLIEGHTDAIGSDAANLALSDRRAESVALALTEYYAVPPANLVVQGYGETELRVPTLAAEQRNRRAVVRMISPLLQRQASN